MRNLITKTLAFGSLALLGLASCKKDGALVTLNGTTTAPGTLTANTTTPVLTKATLTATSVTFTSTAPNYGYSASVTNTLQFDVHSDGFAKVKKEVVLPVGTLSQSYNVLDFNNILLGMSLPTGVSAQVDVRIKSSLSATAGIIYSNVVTLTVTPFALVSYVYVPGAYEGWNNPGPQEDSLQSATGNGIYTGIINFTTGNNQFLIVPVKNWNNKYATNDGASIAGPSSNYTVVYNGANNFYAPTVAGWYQVTLNVNNNTISIVPTAYYSVIGDAAQGWGTDTDMKFNNGTQTWQVTTALNTTGAFKVRKNHDWGTSYGWPTSSVSPNLTSSNGNNISVTAAGNYLISFSVNAADNTQATYTAVKQ